MKRAIRAITLLLPPTALFLVATAQEQLGPVGHDDELAWIANAYYGELAFSGDFRNPDWQLLPAKDSPPLGKYAFATALRSIGRPIRSIEPLASWYARYQEVPGAWGTGDAHDHRKAIADRLDPGRLPSVLSGTYRPIGADQLRACRRVALIGGMLATLGVASIGLALRGPVTALIAGLAFALHPITVPASVVALFDTMAVAWSTLAVRLLIAMVVADGWKRWAIAIALGLSMAAAVGTKMNALIVVAIAVLACGFLAGRWKDRSSRGTAMALAISLAIALVAFIAINPALYANVVEGLADLFRLPAETTRVQSGFLPDFLGSAWDKVVAVGKLIVRIRVGFWVVLAIGAMATALAFRDRSNRARWIVVAWFWAAMVLVVAWIPFPWPRYAMPAVPCACLLAADSLAGVAGLIWRGRASGLPSQPEGRSATMSGR